MAMTGIGGWGKEGWNFFGSTESPGPEGPICNPMDEDYCYEDCGTCTDKCWWTTCKDSVEQTMDVLNYVLDNYCVDMSMVWATGCSNGAMFLYSLARDPRIKDLLAGIAPMVGSPHYGFD